MLLRSFSPEKAWEAALIKSDGKFLKHNLCLLTRRAAQQLIKTEQHCPSFPSPLAHPQRMGLPDKHCIMVAAELSVRGLMSASVHAWLLIFIYFHQLLFSTMNKMQLISVLYIKREKRIENFNTEEQGQ